MDDSSSDDEIEFLGVKPAEPIEIDDDSGHDEEKKDDKKSLPTPDGVMSLSNAIAATSRTTTSTASSSAQHQSQQQQRQRQHQQNLRQQQQSRGMTNFAEFVRESQRKQERKPPPPHLRHSSSVQRPHQQQQQKHQPVTTARQQPWNQQAVPPQQRPRERHPAFSQQKQQQQQQQQQRPLSPRRPVLHEGPPKQLKQQQQQQRRQRNNFVDLCDDSESDDSISIEKQRRSRRRRFPASGPFARVTAAAGTHQEPIVLFDLSSSSSVNDDDDDSSSSSSSAASNKTFRFDDDNSENDKDNRKPAAALLDRQLAQVPRTVMATTTNAAATTTSTASKQRPQQQVTLRDCWDSSDDELDVLQMHVATKKTATKVNAATGTAATSATSNKNKIAPFFKALLRLVPKGGRSARALQTKSAPVAAPKQPPLATTAKTQAVVSVADASKKDGNAKMAAASKEESSLLQPLQKPVDLKMLQQRSGEQEDGTSSLYSAVDKHNATNKNCAASFREKKKSSELQPMAVEEEAKASTSVLLPKKRPAEPESPRDVKRARADKKLNVQLKPGLAKYSPQRNKMEPVASSSKPCQDVISIDSDNSEEASGDESLVAECSSLSETEDSKQGSEKDKENTGGQVTSDELVKLKNPPPSQSLKAITEALDPISYLADSSSPSATGSRATPMYQRIPQPVQQFSPSGALIATYRSIYKAVAATGVSRYFISACLQGNRELGGGFMWKYVRGESNAESSINDGVSGDDDGSCATYHQKQDDTATDDSLSRGQKSPGILENPHRLGASIHDESDLESDTEVDYEDEDPELPMSMSMASSHKCIENGLPVWRFSVHAGSDEILYDFKIQVAPSSIPNSGLGAFLTYMGARILRDECRELSARIIEESTVHCPLTMTPLVADLVGGTREMVRLTGENIHGNFNSVYWPNTSVPVKAKMRKDGLQKSAVFQKHHEKLHLVGRGMQSHPELENRPKDGIGHLGLHTDSDYEPVTGIAFSENLCIDLGIYGPLSFTDRKEAFLFDIKSFLFSDEPGEWAYGVVEKLRGSAQIIDITSDLTGKPHEAAREEVPMYVNETGHNHSKYTQNVFVGEADNRTVHYFFRTTKTLRGSETVELLTNYRHTYETSRERKGYGLKNIYRGDKSDEDRALRLRRNLRSRIHVEESLSEVSLPEMYRHLKYIFENIWTPLSTSASEFLDRSDDSPLSPLSCLQWKALFRLNWLAGKFSERIDTLKEELSGTGCFKYHVGFHSGCKKMLEQIELAPTPRLLSESLLDSSGLSVRQTVLEEVTEEMFFDARDRIRLPFNNSFWCQVGSDFLGTLSLKIAEIGFRAGDLDELRSVFCETARSSMQRIEECSLNKDGDLKELAFESGTRCRSISYKSVKLAADTLRGFDSNCFVGHDTTPKMLQAALVHFLEEEMFDEGEHNNPGQLVHLGAQGGLVMVKMPGYRGPSEYQSLASVPRSLSIVSDESNFAVNKAWYQVWQVLYVAHVFASSLVPQFADEIIQELCPSFGLDCASVDFAINRGIRSERNAAGNALFKEANAGPRAEFEERVRVIRQKAVEKMDRLDAEAMKRGKKANWKKVTALKDARNHKHASKVKVAKGKKTHKTKHKTSTRHGVKPLVYEGPPTSKLPDGWNWPEGWSQKTYKRKSGESAGQTDDYFFSPKLQVKLRSRRDVVRFLERLKLFDGDEEAMMQATFKSS